MDELEELDLNVLDVDIDQASLDDLLAIPDLTEFLTCTELDYTELDFPDLVANADLMLLPAFEFEIPLVALIDLEGL